MKENNSIAEKRLTIGRQLASLRVSKGLSVRKLGDLSGVSHQNITKIETNKYNPSVDVLNRLGAVLGFSVGLIPDE